MDSWTTTTIPPLCKGRLGGVVPLNKGGKGVVASTSPVPSLQRRGVQI
ncbi:MAG: hypothetical protein AAB257_07285 [Nitrospinota bacterium]